MEDQIEGTTTILWFVHIAKLILKILSLIIQKVL